MGSKLLLLGAGQSKWTPKKIPNLVGWAHPRNLPFAIDAAVTSMVNHAGTAVTFARPSGFVPTHSSTGGNPALRMGTTTALMEVRLLSLPRLGHTIIIAVKPDDLGLNNVWENAVAANFLRTQQAAGQMALVGGNAGNYYLGSTTLSTGIVAAYSVDSNGFPTIYGNGTRTWMYRSQAGTAIPAGAAFTDLDLGGFVGYMQDALIFSRKLTDAEVLKAIKYVHRVTGIPAPADPVRHITFTGDSLTVGSSAVGFWSGVCRDLSGPSVVQQRGRGGATVSNGTNNLLTNIPAFTMPSLADSPAKRIACVWIGTNDLAEGFAPATVIANIASYVTALRAEGHTHIAVCTAIARNAADPFNANRLTFNTGLTTAATGADIRIDLAAASELSNSANATYFQGDGVHLTDAGHAIVRGIVGPALAAL